MTLEKSKSIEAGLQSILVEDDLEKASAQPTLRAKIRLIFSNITVEPILVCYVLPCVMASLAVQNLNLEKACRVNLRMESALCDALAARNASGYNHTQEEVVQKLVATMNAWKNVIQSLVPSMLMLFLGSWSDRRQRRKPCIILPILGEILSTGGFLLCAHFFYQLPMELNAFFESVPPSLTGGWFAMFMAVYSYISGICSVEARTLRIGAVSLFSNVSITIGTALSGVLYRQLGFYGIFSVSLVMYAVGVLYAVFVVKEPAAKRDASASTNPVKDFFDVRHIKETFQVAFKDGAKDRKRRICTIMVLVMVIIGPMHGEMNVMYLFVRYKFGWNEIDYSIYSTFHFVVHVLGTVFSLTFFTKFLKVDDAILGMISSVSKICACLVYALAPNSTVFYVGAIVEAFNGTSFIAMRSIMSKLVPADELGKINSLFGVSEALMPLIYGPMYSLMYKSTIHYLPGAFYLLGGALTTPAILIFLWLYRQHLNDREEEREKAQKINLLQK